MCELIDWTNKNSGFLGLLIFLTTLFIGWIAGFFNFIRKRPKFKIRIIEQATFGCIIDLNRTYNDLPVHKTAVAVYMEVTNVGNAPASIGKLRLGYLLSDLRPKWRTSRNWIPETFAKSDFRVKFNDSEVVKGYPFLKQKNENFNNSTDNYLEVGKSVNGIVYFEAPESYGSWMPRMNKDLKSSDLKLEITDSFGKTHSKKFTIDLIDPNYTLMINPYFGQTQYEYFIKKADKNE